MSKGNNLQSLFCGILFCISVAALVIACLAFTNKGGGKGEYYKDKSKQLKYKYTNAKNECNPAKNCNVCAACCKGYITDGPDCDKCVKEKCTPGPMPGTVYRSSTNSCTKKDASDCPPNPDPNASSIPGTKICEDGICKYPVKITGCTDGPPGIKAGLGYQADKYGNFTFCFNTPGANWGVVQPDKGSDTSIFGLDLYPWKKTGSACTKGDLVSSDNTCVNTCNLTQGKGVISSYHDTAAGLGGSQYRL